MLSLEAIHRWFKFPIRNGCSKLTASSFSCSIATWAVHWHHTVQFRLTPEDQYFINISQLLVLHEYWLEYDFHRDNFEGRTDMVEENKVSCEKTQTDNILTPTSTVSFYKKARNTNPQSFVIKHSISHILKTNLMYLIYIQVICAFKVFKRWNFILRTLFIAISIGEINLIPWMCSRLLVAKQRVVHVSLHVVMRRMYVKSKWHTTP